MTKPSKNKKRTTIPKDAVMIGWRESVSLVDLGINHINVKVDTGAQTSALHADHVELIKRGGVEYVKFTACPVQRAKHPIVKCRARLLEFRNIRSSNGVVTYRPVIETTVRLGDREWPIELTLINRDQMGFRMLLGRNALPKGYLVNVQKSYIQSSPVRRKK